jgi:hypothetical protein
LNHVHRLVIPIAMMECSHSGMSMFGEFEIDSTDIRKTDIAIVHTEIPTGEQNAQQKQQCECREHSTCDGTACLAVMKPGGPMGMSNLRVINRAVNFSWSMSESSPKSSFHLATCCRPSSNLQMLDSKQLKMYRTYFIRY